ncbi:DUF3182 family protein [Ideonella sp.]|uniref:DUF3182 family protein n=1 Tax=Ideonella sp. TaxID=1929293 RepID=UPI0035AE7855
MLNALSLPLAPELGPWATPADRTRVGFLRNNGREGPLDHDAAAKARVAESLAELLGLDYAGVVEAAVPSDRPLYLVPSDTLTSLEDARRLGIRGPEDFFGGVVPHAFVATKLVSHPLVRPEADAPAGWCTDAEWRERIQGATLPGWSVFTPADAREAARRLLVGGSLRLKDPAGVGGLGQWVVHNLDELDTHLLALGESRIARAGLVLERNLRRVVTHSVGQARVGPHLASYHGTQVLTTNHRGVEVYGGSTLRVVRGGFDALLEDAAEDAVRRAVERARVFHDAVMAAYPGTMASRCNYDIAEGVDDAGRAWCGVLEQSWRIGGASGAEIAALHALHRDPGLRRVRASTCETYIGPDTDTITLPPGAWLLYDGPDAHGGRLVKHVTVSRDVDA